jgi:hypothetical protein
VKDVGSWGEGRKGREEERVHGRAGEGRKIEGEEGGMKGERKRGKEGVWEGVIKRITSKV